MSYVFEENRAGCPDLAYEFVVVVLNVDMIIVRLIVRLERVKVGLGERRRVLVQEVPSCNDPCRYIP